jgi:negative regulator of sigma E activity
MQRVQALLTTAYAEVPIPPDFNRQLQERLHRVRSNPWLWLKVSGLGYPIAVAAMVVVAVTVALVSVQRQRTPAEGEHLAGVTTKQTNQPTLAAPEPSSAVRENTMSESNSGQGSTLTESRPPLSLGVAQPEDALLATDAFSDELQVFQTMEGFSTMALTPSGRPVILVIRDERNKQEKVVTIPSMLFGSQSIPTSTEVSRNEVGHVF